MADGYCKKLTFLYMFWLSCNNASVFIFSAIFLLLRESISLRVHIFLVKNLSQHLIINYLQMKLCSMSLHFLKLNFSHLLPLCFTEEISKSNQGWLADFLHASQWNCIKILGASRYQGIGRWQELCLVFVCHWSMGHLLLYS